jgi:hypothetical protein
MSENNWVFIVIVIVYSNHVLRIYCLSCNFIRILNRCQFNQEQFIVMARGLKDNWELMFDNTKVKLQYWDLKSVFLLYFEWNGKLLLSADVFSFQFRWSNNWKIRFYNTFSLLFCRTKSKTELGLHILLYLIGFDWSCQSVLTFMNLKNALKVLNFTFVKTELNRHWLIMKLNKFSLYFVMFY